MTRDAITLELDPAAIGQAVKGTGDTHQISIDPDKVEQDLARLVLGLMAFLRELMELQAIRQMEDGLLSPTQEEQLGTTLMRAEAAIHDLAGRFGLTPDDLSLDLGPLGRTI
ncbi:gas vesicle protein K [Sulfitobacter sp. JB4-11]|uniref:gas vesicle protein K n=1 Tax=Sulfitobacter rhodophyticola TaxID=3238304 RepID=UPI0035136727